MKHVRIFLVIIFSFCIINLFAQYGADAGSSIYDLKVKASSTDQINDLSKYTSVDYYRGTMIFNLPLYVVQEKNLTIPLLLNYNGGGIKVDQAPTWVGLGFNLIAGSITRNLKGNYDEKAIHGYINTKSFNNGQFEVDPLQYNSITSNLSLAASGLNQNESKLTCIGCETDTQPDEFNLQLPGLSTVFYLNKNGVPVSSTKYKITYSYDQSQNWPQITAWQIVDQNGITYQFQQQEKSSSVYAGNTWRCHGGNSGNVIMSWYLTKVISSDGKNSIDLQYENDGSAYNRLRVYASEYYLKNIYQYTTATGGSQTGPTETYSYVSGNSSIEPVYLSGISTSNINITFERVNSGSSFERRKLSKISINTKSGEELKAYIFNYKDYMGLALDGLTPASNGRFLLTSVQEVHELNGQVTDQIPPFKFEYNETPIAYGGDLAQDVQICGVDHWGYYTGQKTFFKSRIPLGTITGLAPSFQGIGDRSPSPNFMKAGSLTKVILPWGGNIQYEYEPHDYSYVSTGSIKSSKIIAGGLRIKKIVNSDGVNLSNDIIKTFNYLSPFNSQLSSGVIENEPAYYFQYTSQSVLGGYRPFSLEVWSDDPISPIDIGYSSVVEQLNNGYKVYRYTTSLDYPYVGFPSEISYLSQEASYYSLYPHQLFKTKGRYNYMRGLLIQEINYNNSGNLVSKTQLSYTPREINNLFSMERITQGQIGFYSRTPYFLYFSRNYYVPIGKADLNKRETFFYDPTMDQDAISPILTKTTLYEYNSSNYAISKQTTFESDGNQLINYFKYALDYGSIPSNVTGYVKGIKNLQDRNVISIPVEQYVVKQSENGTNQRVLNGSINLFNDTQPYIEQVHNLDILTPIPFVAATFSSSISGNVFTKNGSYKIQQTIDTYDNYGNMASRIKRDQVRESYIWGYNGCQLIAMVTNAKASEIWHTSFEDSEGNSLLGDSKTGKRSKTDGYSKTMTGLTAGSSYYLTYFKKENGVWVFHKDPVNAGSSVYIITISGQVDEVRFYPQNSQMTSFTYDPAYGVTSSTDQNNITIYQEYDFLGRPKQVRNDNGDLETQFSYYYKGN